MSTWTPPLFITAPPLGLTEVAPAPPTPWTTPATGFYFVYEAGGTDTNNPFGTPLAPRRTIPLNLPAKSTVYVYGPYTQNHTSPYGIHAAGAPGAPVFISGGGPQVTQLNAGMEVNGTQLIIEKVRSIGMTILDPSDGVAVRDFEVIGNKTSGGVGIVAWRGGATKNVVLLRHNIHDCGDVNATFDQDVHAIGVGVNEGSVDGVWVLDGEMARCSGDGIQVNGVLPGRVRRVFVGRCRSHNHKQTGMWSKTADTVIFSQNTVWGHRPGNSSFGPGIGGQYMPTNLIIAGNEIYDCEYGVGLASYDGPTGSVVIFQNIIHNIHRTTTSGDTGNGWMGGCGIMMAGGVERFVYNNTVVDCDRGLSVVPPRTGFLDLQNTLFAQCGVDHVAYASTLPVRAVARCLVDTNPRLRIDGSLLGWLTADVWRHYIGPVGDPLFADVQFNLAAGSPAYLAGVLGGMPCDIGAR